MPVAPVQAKYLRAYFLWGITSPTKNDIWLLAPALLAARRCINKSQTQSYTLLDLKQRIIFQLVRECHLNYWYGVQVMMCFLLQSSCSSALQRKRWPSTETHVRWQFEDWTRMVLPHHSHGLNKRLRRYWNWLEHKDSKLRPTRSREQHQTHVGWTITSENGM